MTTAATLDATRTPAPPVPARLEDTGLGADQIEQLLVKMLYGGEATGLVLAERVRLPFAILELHHRADALRATRRGAWHHRHIGGQLPLRDDRTSVAARVQYLEINQYIGPAPVPLASYVKQMRALAASRGFIDRERLRGGFGHLIVNDDILEQPVRRPTRTRPSFYGPPGNGKTVLAEGLGRTVGGDMHMPYAIDVEGHIVTMFDPISHEPLEDPEVNPSSIIAAEPRDRRWVRIRRPVVMVGGELTIEMLDLTFNPLARFYEAPLQLKANGGIFRWMTSAASACVRRTC